MRRQVAMQQEQMRKQQEQQMKAMQQQMQQQMQLMQVMQQMQLGFVAGSYGDTWWHCMMPQPSEMKVISYQLSDTKPLSK